MSVIQNGPSVAIIGGGISGLVCANRLSQLGLNNTTVFDTGRQAPGGRCSSRHVMISGQLCTFDHSAQFFTVSDSRFSKIVSYLHRKGAVKIWNSKIGHLKRGHFSSDSTITQAFVGVNGMGDIPKCLAGSLNMKTGTWIGNVKWEDSVKKWRVDRHGFFDYLVVAHNGKCADKLMSSAGTEKVHKLTQVRFGDRLNARDKRMQLCSIWALLVAFPTSLKLPYEGAHVDEDEDISWLANNTAKLSSDPARLSNLECWTVFSTRQFGSRIVADTLIYGTPSANRVDPDETAPTGAVSSGSTLFANISNHVTMRNKCPQENIQPKTEREVTEKLLQAMKRVTGVRELPPPSYTRIQLWGAAVPMNILKGREECVFDHRHNVGICGDWMVSPCIQGAAVSGLALAEKIGQHASGKGETSTSLEPDFLPADGWCIGAFPTDPAMIFKPTS